MKTDDRETKRILQYITFRTGGKTYAIDISCVKEINRLSAVTRVPRAEDFVDGVINLRGAIIPVISIRRKLNYDTLYTGKRVKLIIVEFEQAQVGLIVDEIAEVVKIEADNIETGAEIVEKIGSEYVAGIGKTDDGILVVLDIVKLLRGERSLKNAAV
jgi:purine-binding chemotaxis protein CheW